MTEKRFEVFKTDMMIGINDNGESIGNIYTICDLLNELNDENKQLKQKIKSIIKILNLCEEENTELQKENEKLKQRINDLLYQIGEAGKNNESCRECECFIPEHKYCWMWDMEVEADDVVVACNQRKVKDIGD